MQCNATQIFKVTLMIRIVVSEFRGHGWWCNYYSVRRKQEVKVMVMDGSVITT